ncbi:MAG: PKD domain-containing protein [Candidatus Kapabacteria bacterium]|nr:PKD domain-containing protein [Candidatus Kapabacteria bacterium]
MLVRSILILIFCTLVVDLSAQRQAENWYFGEFAGLNFAGTDPTVLLDGAMTTREGCITVSDTLGRLMFYSDGTDVWTRRHGRMPNGVGLFGNPSSTQSCIVVPWPGRPTQYFVFTADAIENNYFFGLNYSVVDMSANSGDGDVTTKNQVMQKLTSEKITAVRHSNGVDVWLISHDIGNNEFLVYIITRSGVNTVPSRQRLGPAVLVGDIGYLKASSLGTRLAMATSVPGRLNIFRFDRTSGIISAATQISNQLTYGIEFSPSGRFLYASSYLDLGIDQYDLSLPDANVASSRVVIGRTTAPSNGALQLAPNGRIYLAHEGSPNISEIALPDLRGLGCWYRDRAVDLGGKRSRLGLPNMFPAVFSPETTYEIKASGGCVGDTIPFVLEPADSVLNLQWDFGDPTSGSANRGFGNNVRHTYRATGTYDVRVTYRTMSGFDQERFITITIGARPSISAGPDQTICKGQAVVLQALGVAQFSWSPGSLLSDSTSARPRATVTQTTRFILTGRSPEGCASYDTMIVNVLEGSVTVSADTAVCAGVSVKLKASGAQTYEWSPALGLSDPRIAEPLATPPQTTRYRVIGKAASCVDTAYVTVTINQPPQITLSKDASTCAGVDVTIEARGGVRYRWTPAAGIPDPTLSTIVVRPVKTTTYTVYVFTAEGCEDSATVTVTVAGSVTVRLSPDTTICKGTSATLRCSNGGVVQWTDRTTGAIVAGGTVNVSPAITTWYVADVTVGGCTGRDSVRVTVVPGPLLTITPDTSICEGDTLALQVQGAPTVVWSPRTDLEYYDRPTTRAWPRATTTYSVTANNAGCVSTASVKVTVSPRVAIVLQSEQIASTPGSTVSVPITAVSNIVGLEPIILSVRAPESLALVDVVAQPGLRELSRVTIGQDQVTTYEIADVSTAPILCELRLSVYLSASAERVVTCSASPRGCASDGSMNIVLDIGQCAGPMRAVLIGLQAPLSISADPLPFDEKLNLHWTSSSIGQHTIELFTSEGVLLRTETWFRSVHSPTSGHITVTTNDLGSGVYLVHLRTSSGTSSFVNIHQPR